MSGSRSSRSFVVEVHDAPFDIEDLPHIVRNVLFAAGFHIVVRKAASAPPLAPYRFVATDTDVDRFRQCCTVLDEHAFRETLDVIVNNRVALSAAHVRHFAYGQSEFSQADCLPLRWAAELIGQTPQWLAVQRDSWRFYALVHEYWPGELRFLKWQLLVDQDRLAKVLQTLKDYRPSPFLLHHFLQTPHVQLDGLTPRQVIADVAAPLEKLLWVVRVRFGDERDDRLDAGTPGGGVAGGKRKRTGRRAPNVQRARIRGQRIRTSLGKIRKSRSLSPMRRMIRKR